MTAQAQTTSTVTASRSRLSSMRYASIVYLTAPAARPTVLRAVASLPTADHGQIPVRDLPASAFNPKWPL